MERFNIIPPSAMLAPYVKHYWLLESDDVVSSQRVFPSGNIELLFHRGSLMKRKEGLIPATSLSGHTLSFADLIPTGTVKMIAVVFHPYGVKAFFEFPAHELSDLIVSADDLNVRSLKELEDRILHTDDDNCCIRLIESFLIEQLKPFKEYNYKRMIEAVRTIDQCNEELSVSSLAERVYLSKKQFQRIFSEYIGATPKEFMRIIRFHKALYTLQNHPAINFTTLAHACGYYDQAHMINEFKLFSGYTPGQYTAICAPYSDYFST